MQNSEKCKIGKMKFINCKIKKFEKIKLIYVKCKKTKKWNLVKKIHECQNRFIFVFIIFVKNSFLHLKIVINELLFHSIRSKIIIFQKNIFSRIFDHFWKIKKFLIIQLFAEKVFFENLWFFSSNVKNEKNVKKKKSSSENNFLCEKK